MINIHLIVLRKGDRHLFVNGELVAMIHSLRNRDIISFTQSVLSIVGQVEVYPIFYLESFAHKWEHTEKLNYFRWLYTLSNNDIKNIVLSREEVGDQLTRDRLYNKYNLWKTQQENLLMEEIL